MQTYGKRIETIPRACTAYFVQYGEGDAWTATRRRHGMVLMIQIGDLWGDKMLQGKRACGEYGLMGCASSVLRLPKMLQRSDASRVVYKWL